MKSFDYLYGKIFSNFTEDNKTIIYSEFHKNYLENDIGVTSKVINFPNYLNLNQKHDETNQKNILFMQVEFREKKALKN